MTEFRSTLTPESLARLSSAAEGPFLSIYQGTHRRHPEKQQDPIRFRNLLKQLETSLAENRTTGEARRLMEPFEALSRDHEFWNHTRDGLAVLGSPSGFHVFVLQRPVPELAVAASSFHLKPLRRQLQSADRYQVLTLGLHEIHVFEGNRDALDEVGLEPGVPQTLKEALGDQLTEAHLSGGNFGAGGAFLHHGHGGRKDEIEIDAERFFRAVDRAIIEHHSQPSGLPLILAALPEHQSLFRSLTHNQALLPNGIEGDPHPLRADELRQRAWVVMEPSYRSRLTTLADTFNLEFSRGLGSSDPADVGPAAATGRVATLLLEADRQVPGRLDGVSGQVSSAAISDPDVDDLLDDLGELAARNGAEVLVVPADLMPSATGLAAIYRY